MHWLRGLRDRGREMQDVRGSSVPTGPPTPDQWTEEKTQREMDALQELLDRVREDLAVLDRRRSKRIPQ